MFDIVICNVSDIPPGTLKTRPDFGGGDHWLVDSGFLETVRIGGSRVGVILSSTLVTSERAFLGLSKTRHDTERETLNFGMGRSRVGETFAAVVSGITNFTGVFGLERGRFDQLSSVSSCMTNFLLIVIVAIPPRVTLLVVKFC